MSPTVRRLCIVSIIIRYHIFFIKARRRVLCDARVCDSFIPYCYIFSANERDSSRQNCIIIISSFKIIICKYNIRNHFLPFQTLETDCFDMERIFNSAVITFLKHNITCSFIDIGKLNVFVKILQHRRRVLTYKHNRHVSTAAYLEGW